MSDKIEYAWALRHFIEKMVQDRPDEEALDYVCLHPVWSGESVSYDAGCRVRYNDILYKCLTAHISQPTWSPDTAPSLWARVLTSETGEILAWIQPDSTNPYAYGDIVTHNGKTWASIVDNNVWEPGVYGWQEVE